MKINNKMFQYLKKNPVLGPFFWPIFSIFGRKRFCLENLALSHTTSYGFLASRQNLEKTTDKTPRKCLDRRMEGGKKGRTDRPYFIGPFWLLSGVQKVITCIHSSLLLKQITTQKHLGLSLDQN